MDLGDLEMAIDRRVDGDDVTVGTQPIDE